MQLECSLENRGSQPLGDVHVEVYPKDALRKFWNLQQITPGQVYGLLGCFVDDTSVGGKGGFPVDDKFHWGGVLAETERVVITVKPVEK